MSAVQEVLHAATIDDVQAAILDATAPLLPRGGGSKPALSAAGTGIALDLSGLSGILEYDPGEYTFTAYAGTPLAAVRDRLFQILVERKLNDEIERWLARAMERQEVLRFSR